MRRTDAHELLQSEQNTVVPRRGLRPIFCYALRSVHCTTIPHKLIGSVLPAYLADVQEMSQDLSQRERKVSAERSELDQQRRFQDRQGAHLVRMRPSSKTWLPAASARRALLHCRAADAIPCDNQAPHPT
jgi:hypothetical protein